MNNTWKRFNLPSKNQQAGSIAISCSFLRAPIPLRVIDLVCYPSGKEGLRRRDEMVVEYFSEKSTPIAISMAGGYAPNVDDIVDIHFTTIKTAANRMKSLKASQSTS